MPEAFREQQGTPASDSPSPDGPQGPDRWRSILAIGATTTGARGISLVANLLVLPFVVHGLAKAEFGLWMNLTSTFTMLALLDFGVGLAVMGQVSDARGGKDAASVRRVVTTAFVLLTGAALLLLALSGLLAFTLDWNHLLGVGQEVPAPVVGQLVFAVGATAAVSLPLTIAGRVYYALQRGHVAALATSLGVLAQAGALLAVASFAPDLRWFSAAYLSTSLLAGGITTVLLVRSNRRARPHFRDIDRAACGRLGREGVQLFLLTAMGIVSFKSDAFVIGHYLGADRVAEYVLPFTVYALVPTVLGAFLTPLWATYREAWARSDLAWVRTAYLRSVVLASVAGVVVAGVLVPITPWLLRLWIGDGAAVPPLGLLLGLAGYVVIMCASTPVAVFLNGAGALRPQVVVGTLMTVVNVAVSIWFVHRFGLAGPLWATVVTQTFVVLVPCLLVAHRQLTRPCPAARGLGVPSATPPPSFAKVSSREESRPPFRRPGRVRR
ncbi:lipopolysaccharide biosynthesis protein [Streptomyces sp. NPDC007264]|uniref:lipopolysaccharide biosynthesis protein n=1 Tax=Streptomyces sp. NPDC007264 TaxID=3364777 RepID=UPI0036D7E5C6